MTPNVALVETPLDTASLRAAAADPRSGAVLLFEGCARNHHDGRAVEELAYEAFAPMAQAELERIRAEALRRFGLVRCLIHHRLGPVPVGEAAVAIALSGAHRQEAFQAVAWIMDRIKESVPIWKRERYIGGEAGWVEG